ncbi:MAG: hypothetical protein RIR26_120 [Pseudomonadota bacterium]|jgi:hypothetical protein
MPAIDKFKAQSAIVRPKKRDFRVEDELELLNLILAENPALRQRVMRVIEKQVGKQRLAVSKARSEDKSQ